MARKKVGWCWSILIKTMEGMLGSVVQGAKEKVHNAVAAAAAASVDSGVFESPLSSSSNNMPSIRTLSKIALGGAQVLLGGQTVRGTFTQSCPNAQLSCHNTTVVENLCCFNAPGGQILQTQFWDTAPATGPEDSWTLHGLW